MRNILLTELYHNKILHRTLFLCMYGYSSDNLAFRAQPPLNPTHTVELNVIAFKIHAAHVHKNFPSSLSSVLSRVPNSCVLELDRVRWVWYSTKKAQPVYRLFLTSENIVDHEILKAVRP